MELSRDINETHENRDLRKTSMAGIIFLTHQELIICIGCNKQQ